MYRVSRKSDGAAIYRYLGLTRSADGKELLVMGGEDAGPARFTVQPEDINADGRVEVFVIGGNTFPVRRDRQFSLAVHPPGAGRRLANESRYSGHIL